MICAGMRMNAGAWESPSHPRTQDTGRADLCVCCAMVYEQSHQRGGHVGRWLLDGLRPLLRRDAAPGAGWRRQPTGGVWLAARNCRSTHARRPVRSCVLSGWCAQLAHMATGLVGAQWRVHRPAEDLPLELLLTVEVRRAVRPARSTSPAEPDVFADDAGDDADGRGAAQRYGAVFTGERSLNFDLSMCAQTTP
eukprot:COSAG01_NODE_2309_length_7942_cov_7.425602_6_plen_194_part_00